MSFGFRKKYSDLNEKYIRLVTQDGEIFEGECIYNDEEYNEVTIGEKEASLMIDDCCFCVSQIQYAREIPQKSNYIWSGRTEHRMKLNPAPFDKIESGAKTIEMRLWDEKRRKIKPGDVIRFSRTDDPDEVIRVLVKALHVYASFDDLYASLPLDKLGYRESEAGTASPRDMRAYYTAEDELENGVVGIEIELSEEI